MGPLPPIVRNSLLPVAVALAVAIIFMYGARTARNIQQAEPEETERSPENLALPRQVDYSAAIDSVEKLLKTQRLDETQERGLRHLLTELTNEKIEKDRERKAAARSSGN